MNFRHKPHLISIIFLAFIYNSCANDSRTMPDFWAEIDPESQDPGQSGPGTQDPPGDPEDPAKDPQPECTESVCVDETTLRECIEGKIVEKDCSENDGVCQDNACQDRENPPETCTESYCISEETLVLCNEGVPQEVDCSLLDKVCKNDACEDKTEPGPGDNACKKSECANDLTLKQCTDGQFTLFDCSADGRLCAEGTCVTPPSTEITCKESTCSEDGTTLKLCMDGLELTVDCSETERICKDGTCAEPPTACVEEDAACDGNTLKLCVGGFIQVIDCEGENKNCNPSTLTCEYECDENTPAVCLTSSKREFCGDHRIKTEDCGENMICTHGSCIPNPCASCRNDQVCIGGECKDSAPDSLIGIPCSCDSVDCYDTVTGAQFKTLLTKTANLILGTYLDKISDTDEVVFPNFTSPSNIGCEPLKAIVPEGMDVLCLRDSDVTFAESMIRFVSEDVPSVVELMNMGSTTITRLLPMLVTLMENGIHFTSPNGYCMTGALDISGMIDQSPASYAVNTNALQKGGLIDKVNFGDYAKVQEALESGNTSASEYCPQGSVLMNFKVMKEIAKVGHFDVGMVMCLKECQTDADCREGYNCIELPSSVPIEEAEKKMVCFDQNNVEKLSFILGDL